MAHIIPDGFKQLQSSWRWLLIIYTPFILLFLGVSVACVLDDTLSVRFFVGDPVTVGNLPIYAGFISQLGLLLWSSTTTICFFTYFALIKMKSPRKEAIKYSFAAGLLTGYLMLDDTFLLHEELFPNYLKFLPQEAVYLLIGLAALVFLAVNWKEILRSEYGLLFLAFGLFATSIVMDNLPYTLKDMLPVLSKIQDGLEDGAKFLAIVTWVIYYARYAYHQLTAPGEIPQEA